MVALHLWGSPIYGVPPHLWRAPICGGPPSAQEIVYLVYVVLHSCPAHGRRLAGSSTSLRVEHSTTRRWPRSEHSPDSALNPPYSAAVIHWSAHRRVRCHASAGHAIHLDIQRAYMKSEIHVLSEHGSITRSGRAYTPFKHHPP